MSFIDRWPGTPIKQFTGWCVFVSFFLFSLAALWWERDLKMELWYGLAALVLGYNGDGTFQFFAKRKTYVPTVESTTTTETPMKTTETTTRAPEGPVG